MTATTSTVKTYDLTVGRYSFHVNETGDRANPTILWLHGSGPGVSALSNWEHLITRLAGSYHCVAPDLIGFGESTHPDPAPVGMTAFNELRADTTLALVAALGLERVHVVGNSMGGMITLLMLTQAPDRFDKVVLMGSGGAPVAPTQALIEMIQFYQDPSPENMRKLMTNFVYDTATFDGRLDVIAADRVAKATRPQVKRSHLATFNPEGKPLSFTPEYLGAIDKEVLVVHGREDRLIPVEAAVYLSTHLPNAQLHVLPHGGHWIQIEQAARFQQWLEVFLAEVI
jgi:2-hydroxymuconate-semialdehyde hydrolase